MTAPRGPLDYIHALVAKGVQKVGVGCFQAGMLWGFCSLHSNAKSLPLRTGSPLPTAATTAIISTTARTAI